MWIKYIYGYITHVAICAGNGYVTDASNNSGMVVYRPIFGQSSIFACGRPHVLIKEERMNHIKSFTAIAIVAIDACAVLGIVFIKGYNLKMGINLTATSTRTEETAQYGHDMGAGGA